MTAYLLVLMFAAPAEQALAQSSGTPLGRKAVFGSLGFAPGLTEYAEDRALDAAGGVEFAIPARWRVRLGVGRHMSWEVHPGPGSPFSSPDRVSLTRVTASAIRTLEAYPLPFEFYAGFGAGRYHYQFETATDASEGRWGAHGLAGFSFPLRSGHYAIEVEGALHYVAAPRNNPLQIVAAAVVSLHAALKYNF